MPSTLISLLLAVQVALPTHAHTDHIAVLALQRPGCPYLLVDGSLEAWDEPQPDPDGDGPEVAPAPCGLPQPTANEMAAWLADSALVERARENLLESLRRDR